jgi:dTDP-4-dehydrorhamnose reductase
MSKILIIGCNGQLGTDCMSVMPQAAGIDFPEIDIADRFQTLETLTRLSPDVIVNCAAYTAVDACESDPLCWKVNADGPRHLAGWAAANDAFLVHVSTDYVFSGDKPLLPLPAVIAPPEIQRGLSRCARVQTLEESEEPGPVSEYGKSKLAGEQAILGSGAKAAILRTAWLYGATGKNFLKTMLRLALQNPEKEIRVVNDQFGSPTWSHTLARQIAAVIQTQATGVFHATSEGYCSWFDLASRFLQLMDVPHRISPCTTADYPTPAKRPANSILENAALKKAGINLFTDWKEELECFVNENREALLSDVSTPISTI